MQRLVNALKAQAGALDQSAAQPRFGTVQSVDPNSGTVKVSLQPEGVLTGWLPVLSAWTGAGWGLVCLPGAGDQVLVLAQEGDANHGVVVGAAWGQQRTPPTAPAGEFWLVHQSGASLKLTNSGTIAMQGDLHVNGNVYDQHGSLAQLRAHYDAHHHPSGGVPDQQD